MAEEKFVAVTGASSGIGEACALHLAERGFRVWAGVRREEDAWRLRREGGEAIQTVLIDVTVQRSIVEAVSRVSEVVGERGLYGLVNNAGLTVAGPLELVPLEEIRRQIEVNVIGQVAVTQAFLPLLRRARGRIVNMGSMSGRVASPMLGPYAMSKFALEAFTDSLRRELAPWGIEVVILEPGAIDTPIWKKGTATADETVKGLSEAGKALYGDAMKQVRDAASRIASQAIPAAQVATVVHKALTSSRPKTRYPVGVDARVSVRLAQFVPDRVLDWLVRRRLGLP